MNSLFPEENSTIKFNATTRQSIDGNKIEYYIGTEIGIIHKYYGSDYAGYEFISQNGSKYFISTNKKNIPQNYDAAFWLDTAKYPKPTIKTLSSCNKKLIYAKFPTSKRIIDSWNNSFRYKKEVKNKSGDILDYGLRPPQIGALHAIQSHWSISQKAALIVMPTGTGKTETMLSLSISEKCNGLLVIVPSSALRTQIFNKFKTLGILKDDKFQIVSLNAKNPKVGFLKTGINSIEKAKQIFDANIIVSTPQIITKILKSNNEITNQFMNWCKYLIMDEAHHSQAKEWNFIKQKIELASVPVLLFTATPFRNDRKRLNGTIIYNYPLSLAQRDNYYKKIVFNPILEFNARIADEKIAEKAVTILKSEISKGYDHIMMARVDTINQAKYIFENIYKKYDELKPVFIHSQLKATERKIILDGIIKGIHKIIVCVDMLGEGFDLPQLKVCALHDLHKNITTSFQFFGRFTRESSLKLGNATIIANIADPNLKGTLKKLYRKDSDWDKIIRHSNEDVIQNVIDEENFFTNFSDAEIPNKIPLRNITPAMSTVVFRIYDSTISWNPEKIATCFSKDKYETISVEHEERNLLVLISKKTESVQWGKIDDLVNCCYDLYILYLNPEQKLLYINSSNNSSTHNRLAESVVGKNINLFNEADIYRCLDEIFQLELFNLGLKSVLNGPISFTMYAGNGIVSGLDELDNNTKSSSNLFGVGYKNGEKISIGCSSKGRVWTKLVKTIPDFTNWCDDLGIKLLDTSIDTKDIFKFIQKPEQLTKLPLNKVPVSIKWSEGLYFHPTMATIDSTPLADYKIDICSFTETTVQFNILSETRSSKYQIKLKDNKNDRGYKYSFLEGFPIKINFKNENVNIMELFYEFPPIIWFHDNSKMYNNIYFPFKGNIQIFNINNIIPYNWDGVNILKESQKSEKRSDSIQYNIIKHLKRNKDYKIIFDDDDANEASDIIAIKYFESVQNKIVVELFHCKFSSKNKSGGRLKDLYEVCGQAQRSYHWKHNAIELINHMIRRESNRINKEKTSRFEVGGNEELQIILNMLTSGYCQTEFKIYVVQPGISKDKIVDEKEHLKLLGATDLLLKKTGNEFYIISAK